MKAFFVVLYLLLICANLFTINKVNEANALKDSCLSSLDASNAQLENDKIQFDRIRNSLGGDK